MTVTTKFGLQPPGGAVARLSWLKPLARRLMRLSPGVRKALSAQSGRMVQSGAYAPDQAGASLEVSLRELRTDRVEILLLHEAGPADCSDTLRAFLDDAARAGRIGTYGVGSRFDRVQGVARDRPDFARVLQFDSSVTRPNREALALPPTSFTITHGAIGGSFTDLKAFLADRPEVVKRWSDDLGLDLADSSGLAALMLASALSANPGGVVLFSSTRPRAIRENLAAIADGRFPPDQIDRFASLARGSVESTTAP